MAQCTLRPGPNQETKGPRSKKNPPVIKLVVTKGKFKLQSEHSQTVLLLEHFFPDSVHLHGLQTKSASMRIACVPSPCVTIIADRYIAVGFLVSPVGSTVW